MSRIAENNLSRGHNDFHRRRYEISMWAYPPGHLHGVPSHVAAGHGVQPVADVAGKPGCRRAPTAGVYAGSNEPMIAKGPVPKYRTPGVIAPGVPELRLKLGGYDVRRVIGGWGSAVSAKPYRRRGVGGMG
jgi:hypothetical protein